MDQFGQNAFAPGMKSALFVPDQLVAGTLQLVTDTGIITGGAFKRGTVLGLVAASGKYTQCVKTAEDGSQLPVAILVDDVDASFEGLKKKGIDFITVPMDMDDWGIRVAHFRDPESNLIEIYTELKG